MHKDREIKDAKGNIIHLEKPEFGVLIRNRQIVNEDGYRVYMERQRLNALAPVKADPALVEQTKQEESKLQDKKYEELEKKVGDMNDMLSQILNKLDGKN